MKSTTMTKTEVCEHLGKSKRTVDAYMSDGRLPFHYFNGPNGKQAIFERADVDRMKTVLDAPIEPNRTALENVPPHLRDMVARRAAVAQALAPAPDVQSLALALRAALQPMAPRVKPWLALTEAAAFSGLPASWLLAQAKAGAIRAVNVATGTRERWRFNRNALVK